MLSFTAGSPASGCAVSIRTRAGRAGSGREEMIVAGGIEQKVQDRDRAVGIARRAAQAEQPLFRIVPGLLGDQSAVRFEPGDVEDARRRLALAVQEMTRAQRRMGLAQRDQRAAKLRSSRPCGESTRLQSNQEISLSWQ